MSGSIKFKRLQATHPRLNVDRTRMLRALYRGGRVLLDDPRMMDKVFPSYTHEKPEIYLERKKRAFYENMFALVVNQISAGLAQDPIRFEENKDEEEELDEYWSDLLDNATALSDDQSSRRTLDQVMRDAAVEALVTGWAWLQCDLPSQSSEKPPPSTLLEQQESGALRAYVIPWPTECVTDWSEQSGRLNWLKTYECIVPDEDPSKERDTKIHTYVIWERETWTRYEIVQNKERPNLPGPEDLIEPVLADQSHSFARVPWTRLDLTSQTGAHLHVGDVIESLCRNYFNRQCGESFQWSQFYYQQLYEFLGPETPGIDNTISEAQTDSNRPRRPRAPGVVHVRGADDRAEFVGPDMAGAEVGRSALQDLRDAILRITAQMALAQDTSGAMLRRSADSKRQDSVAQEIVLGAIGKRLMTASNSVAQLLATGRGDAEPPSMVGYERFNVTDAEQLIAQDFQLEAMNIPSATFQVERKFQLACTRLGDNASQETRDKIREELEEAITQDQLTLSANPPLPGDPELGGTGIPDTSAEAEQEKKFGKKFESKNAKKDEKNGKSKEKTT